MQVAAFVAVVRSNFSGKETRGRLPYGLAVRAVQEHFQVSGRRIAMEESVPHFLLARGGGITGSNDQLHDMGERRHRPPAVIVLGRSVNDEITADGEFPMHGDLVTC